MKAKSRIYFRGFMAALAKRLVFVFLVLLVIQIATVQLTVESSDDRAAEAGQERLRKALAENQREHEKTQRYLRCIVLLPIDERTEDNFAKCGETGVVDPAVSPAVGTDSSTAPTARNGVVTTSGPPDRTASPTMNPPRPVEEEQVESAREPYLETSLTLPIIGTEVELRL